ncbi:hypothetical protein EEW87_004200 [Janibacter melonis]|uniref:Uncharacterized protein n=1 Tax=Janibacter melonis TaxID=262209 RepID=A0A5P8FKL2_9MICO|nr:hypothetical protein [Janibacter melonis]QFQ29701.1 hypothetical protein EEW87_004200 [Janibacter melonis]
MTAAAGSLVVVNVVAFVLIAVALVRALGRRIPRTDTERALLFTLGAMVVLLSVGLLRRIRFEYADQAAFVAFVVTAAVGWWLLQRTTRR